jgi:pimeloyl-ACP methyl ester carboxylesterase
MPLRKSVHFFIRILLLTIPTLDSSYAQGLPQSMYIRNNGSDRVIIFVHGLLGDSVSTWTNGKSYWPRMIANDHDFDGVDVFVYQYPTSIDADLTPDQVADDMSAALKANGVSDRKQLIFLSHSMGGIVTRAYLLKYREIATKTVFLQFYSTPTEGASVATIADLALQAGNVSHAQIEKLKNNIEKDYLGDQKRAWQAARFELTIPSYCAYEEYDTYGFKVVSYESATALCNSATNSVEADHIGIVKPLDTTSQSYAIFKANFKDAFDHALSKQINANSLIVNNAGSQIGFVRFNNNLVIGSPATVLDNAGAIGEVSIGSNYFYNIRQSGTPAIINNSGQIGQASVLDNHIHLEDRIPIEWSHNGPEIDGQLAAVSRSDMTIPVDLLNNHGVLSRYGTFVSGISFDEKVPTSLEYITVAIRGSNLLGFQVIGKQDRAILQVPIAGYRIVKFVRPTVLFTLVIYHSQAVCYCEGMLSWSAAR